MIYILYSLHLIVFLSCITIVTANKINNIAVITYCSCDSNGCVIYEKTNRIKDKYCEKNGCDHIIYSMPAHIAIPIKNETVLFKDLTKHNGTSIMAMWTIVHCLLITLEKGNGKRYDWVFLTGGDQIIINDNLSLLDLLPKACLDDNKFDIFIPINTDKMSSGLMSPPLIRNTEKSRSFIREWWQYSLKGNFLVEDQTVMNYLIIRDLIFYLKGNQSVLDGYFKAGHPCQMTTDGPLYDQMNNGSYMKMIKKRSDNFLRCHFQVLYSLYGNRPFTSKNKGRLNSTICLFEVHGDSQSHCRSLPKNECGLNWNADPKKLIRNNTFMIHLNGPKTIQIVNRAVNNYYNKSSLQTPSSVYDKCVKQFL